MYARHLGVKITGPYSTLTASTLSQPAQNIIATMRDNTTSPFANNSNSSGHIVVVVDTNVLINNLSVCQVPVSLFIFFSCKSLVNFNGSVSYFWKAGFRLENDQRGNRKPYATSVKFMLCLVNFQKANFLSFYIVSCFTGKKLINFNIFIVKCD